MYMHVPVHGWVISLPAVPCCHKPGYLDRTLVEPIGSLQ